MEVWIHAKAADAPGGARRLRRGKADWTNRETSLPPQGVRAREARPNQRMPINNCACYPQLP